jgi:hypothetical protein
MQFNLPALPLPRFHAYFSFDHARAWAALLGPLLVAQWLLPWGGGLWSWNIGAGVYWALLAGLILSVLAFVPIPNLKGGHVFLATAILGVTGLGVAGAVLRSDMPVTLFFFLSPLGLIGLATTLTALTLWSRHGYRPFYEKLLLGGLGALGLGLLVPMGFGVPLARLFTQLGDDAPNILARLVFFLLTLAFLGLLALTVANVLLKKEGADREQVERLARALFHAPFAMLFLYGFMTFFSGFGLALHLIITLGASLFLAVQAAVVTLERADAGESFQTLIQRP